MNASNSESGRKSWLLRLSAGLFRVVTRLLLILLFIGGGLAIGGFFRFASNVTEIEPASDPPKTAAIVALTGGSSRIARGVELLAEGRGARLLISGANPAASDQAIRNVNRSSKALFDCCVDIGREARDTIGNAMETKAWASQKGYESLLLVTSAYHMPRALLEFRREMPNVTFVPDPVLPPGLQKADWWHEGDNLRLVISEYLKYLGAVLRGYLQPSAFSTLRASLTGSAPEMPKTGN